MPRPPTPTLFPYTTLFRSNLTYLLKLDGAGEYVLRRPPLGPVAPKAHDMVREFRILQAVHPVFPPAPEPDRKSTRLNSSHLGISYAVFCLKKKMHAHDLAR